MAGEGPEAGSGEEWALMGVIPAAEGYSISIGNRSARSLIKITAICQFLISRTAYFDIVVLLCLRAGWLALVKQHLGAIERGGGLLSTQLQAGKTWAETEGFSLSGARCAPETSLDH